jgi:1,2-diacylglycerol 3-beta-glucosyltransferase
MLTTTAAAALAIVAIPVAAGAGYLLAIVALSGKRPAPTAEASYRFQIIVPAHNEELGIASTVENLRAMAYPADKFSIVVVADNCSDATARVAREAGARVLERNDEELRGKGYALAHAFERLPEDVDAVVVVDADTLVSPNLLSAFAARIERGAGAVQADYAVRNPQESWRTRLMAIALGSFHVARSRARERVGLSAGLRGNGMCFTRELLRRVPHDAFSVVEDVEYGLRLGELGQRVHYADEAHVYGEMVTSGAAAASQRKRWEGGRRALAKAHGWRLLRKGISERNAMIFDLGLDLLMPPLSRIAASALGGTLVSSSALLLGGAPFLVPAAIWSGSLASVGVYVLRGWSLSGTGVRGLVTLACAPGYVVWKAGLGIGRNARADGPWIRTKREAEPPAAPSNT